MRYKRIIAASVVMCVCLSLGGCGQAEKQLAHEMKVFALAYHQMAQWDGQLLVDDAGVGKIDWRIRPGPAKLEEMAAVESDFPDLAKRIRDGTFVVVWKAKFRASAEENSKYYLGHEAGIEEKGGWVLRADGWPEKVTAEVFRSLRPISSE